MFSRDIAIYHKQRTKRSLAEAFPRDYADPIEHYSRPSFGLGDLIRALICVAAAALIGALAAQGF